MKESPMNLGDNGISGKMVLQTNLGSKKSPKAFMLTQRRMED